MADTETIRGDDRIVRAPADKPQVDRLKTLALAAADDAFQQYVKDLFTVLHRVQVDSPAGYPTQKEYTANGLKIARAAWDDLRKMITEVPADG